MAGKRLVVVAFLVLAISLLGLGFQKHPASAIRWWDPGAELLLRCLPLGGSVSDPSCGVDDDNPYQPSLSADIETNYVLPHPSTQFATGLLVSFLDPDFQMTAGSSMDLGAVLGTVRSDTYLGTLNNPCYYLYLLTFRMENGTTDISNTFAVAADMSNTNDLTPAVTDPCYATQDPELQNHVDCYPDFNNRMFDPDGPGALPPLTPLVRMTGYSTVAGADILLQFLVFDRGAFPAGGYVAPHPYSQFDTSWGYPSVTLLLDPSAPAKPSTINFLCPPMMSAMSLYGKTQDNPATTADEGGDVARTNPATAGTHYYNYLSETYRNPDEDAWESNYETCQLCPNQEDGFRVDADGDLIDACCDTVANGTLGPAVDDGNDFDSDLYNNGNDNCPLVSNPFPQTESERSQPWPKDAGINFDDIGDACEGRAQDIMLPNAPTAETGAACNNNVDDDHDGWFDEGCVVDKNIVNGTYQAAFNLVPACFGNPAVDTDGDGFCDATETALGSNPASAPINDHDGDKIPNPPPYTSYPYTACSNGTTSCVDNCPIDYNPLQRDADGDKIGDACDLWPTTAAAADYDGDGYANNADPCPQHDNLDPLSTQDNDQDGIGDYCDPMPNVNYSPFGRPENAALVFSTPLIDAGARPNGVVKDPNQTYTEIDQKIAMDGLQQVCDDGIDNDQDGQIDKADPGCAGAQTNDRDGDGGTDAVEWWVGTDTLDKCGNDCGGAAKHDAWAFDLNKDCWVSSSDILAYPANITMPAQKGALSPYPYQQRYDVAPDNWINSSDILMFPARVAMPKQCTNP